MIQEDFVSRGKSVEGTNSFHERLSLSGSLLRILIESNLRSFVVEHGSLAPVYLFLSHAYSPGLTIV